MPIATTNPATGEILKTFDPLTAEQIEAKLSLAVKTFAKFRHLRAQTFQFGVGVFVAGQKLQVVNFFFQLFQFSLASCFDRIRGFFLFLNRHVLL